MKIFAACIMACLFPFIGFSQQVTISSHSFPLGGVVSLRTAGQDFAPVLSNLESPQPGGASYAAYLNSIKDAIVRRPDNGIRPQMAEVPNLSMKEGFVGNKFQGNVPNDNDMAVSKSGQVVSVVNSTLYIFDKSGNEQRRVSLEKFTDTLGRKEGKFDPRVLYDPVGNRFVVACLNGFNDSTNFIILAFSKTADALGDWNLYLLPGNNGNDTTWSDYPIIGIQNGKFYLTINSILNDSTWQAGFRRSNIWQMPLSEGYSGKALDTKIYSIFSFGGRVLRNLCPAPLMGNVKSDTLYSLSNLNFSAKDNRFNLIMLDPSGKITVEELTANRQYGVSPDAVQPDGNFLATNDARVLDALRVGSTIWFAGNSLDSSTGKASIYLGKLNISNRSVELFYPGPSPYEFGYPGVAVLDDGSVGVVANYVSATDFPGVGVWRFRNGSFSDYFILKQGTSIINILNGKLERWGDYIGIQNDPNDPSSFWIGGTFGVREKINNQGFNVQGYGTWLAMVHRDYNSSVLEKPSAKEALLYPNPVEASNRFSLNFQLSAEEVLNFRIQSADGRISKLLLTEMAKAGENLFSLDARDLPKGAYVLQVEGQKTHLSMKFIVD